MVAVAKIKGFRLKTLHGKLLRKLKNSIKKSSAILVHYYYWLYFELYQFKVNGYILSIKNKYIFNLLSFLLFYKIKNISINQLYFITSPFIIGIEKQNRIQKLKGFYIL